MPEKKVTLADLEASIRSLDGPGMRLICGIGGTVVAAKGIRFAQADLPVEHGKLVVATADTDIKVGEPDPKTHITELSTTGKNTGINVCHIRLPVGVNLFRIDVADGEALFVETGAGHNIVPKFLPREQTPYVQELVMMTTPVPPRKSPQELSSLKCLQMKVLSPKDVTARMDQSPQQVIPCK